MKKLVALYRWITCSWLMLGMLVLFTLFPSPPARAGQYFSANSQGAMSLWDGIAFRAASTTGLNTIMESDASGLSAFPAYYMWNGSLSVAARSSPAANAIVVSGPTGTIDLGWLPPNAGLRNVQIFKTAGAGSYTATSNVHAALVYAIGGGAAGGGAAATSSSCSAGAGGGAGGVAMNYYTNIVGGQTYTFTIGAAGTGVSGGTGNNGGNTTFYNTALTITGYYGSGGGTCGGTTCLSQFGSTSGITNAWFNTSGTPATGGICMSASLGKSGNGAGNIWGGGSNGQVGTAAGQYPAATESYQCGIGGGGALNLGTQSAIAGSAGTAGCVIIFEYE